MSLKVKNGTGFSKKLHGFLKNLAYASSVAICNLKCSWILFFKRFSISISHSSIVFLEIVLFFFTRYALHMDRLLHTYMYTFITVKIYKKGICMYWFTDSQTFPSECRFIYSSIASPITFVFVSSWRELRERAVHVFLVCWLVRQSPTYIHKHMNRRMDKKKY